MQQGATTRNTRRNKERVVQQGATRSERRRRKDGRKPRASAERRSAPCSSLYCALLRLIAACCGLLRLVAPPSMGCDTYVTSCYIHII